MLGRKPSQSGSAGLLAAFMQAWDSLGGDEMTVCSRALDIFRATVGDRSCCIWKRNGNTYEQLCERDMVPISARRPETVFETVLPGTETKPGAVRNGHSTYVRSASNADGGLLYVPIRIGDEHFGFLAASVSDRERSDESFVAGVELFGGLVALTLHNLSLRVVTMTRERRLQAEVDATTRELESTNAKLIERVRELKTLYKELQTRVEELTKANHAKDEFLSIVSHELRTPLTSLTGFLAVLLEEEAGAINEQQRKFLGIAKQSAGRLNLIISDLLDVSRIESGRLNLEMASCSMQEIVKASVEGLKASAVAKGLELVLHEGPNIPAVWGDASRLQQVADNLISNAVKFTDRGGRVDVRVEEKGDLVQVSVQDTGPGLAAEEQVRVFDMFYQVDATARRAASGTGLGLAIAKGIVTMHGGEILVVSEKGKGATFSFIVPRNKEKKAA